MLIHEIFHALGIDHEMKRPDQKEHVKIFKSNIKSPAQFKTDNKLNYKDYKYDASSLMHYDNKVLSPNLLYIKNDRI